MFRIIDSTVFEAIRWSDEAARSRLHAGRWTTSRGSFDSLDRRHRVDESGLETIEVVCMHGMTPPI